MNWIKAGMVLTLVVVPTKASAEFFDGNEMNGFCATGNDVIHGYAAGLIAADKYSTLPLVYCLPSGVTLGQIKDVYCKYLRENPADRHLNASSLMRRAFNAAWPCSRKGDRQ